MVRELLHINSYKSSVQVMNIDRNFDSLIFSVENRYDYLNLNTCRFIWHREVPSVNQILAIQLHRILKQGEVQGSDVRPRLGGGRS